MSDLFGPPLTEAEKRKQELLDNEAVFGVPVARPTDPHTSHKAARSARPRAGNSRGLALMAFWTAGEYGLTDFELAGVTGRQQNSIGVRRGELTRAGLVEDSGRTRPSTTGSPAVVWVITPNGKMVAHQIKQEDA